MNKKNPFFEATIGPYFLNCALSALLLYVASFLWPLVLIAGVGSLGVWHGKTKGFYGALILLSSCVLWNYSFFSTHLWTIAFLFSIIVSWILLLLGKKQVLANSDALDREKAINCELVQERDRERQQREEWCIECERLSLELMGYASKEKALQKALQDAQSQSHLPTREVTVESMIIQDPLGEVGEGMSQDLKEMKDRYELLRCQFDEKSVVLDQTRKLFFQVETEWIALKKEGDEHSREDLLETFFSNLNAMVEECQEKEEEVELLEKIITGMSAPKKPVRPRKTKGGLGDQDLLSFLASKADKVKIS